MTSCSQSGPNVQLPIVLIACVAMGCSTADGSMEAIDIGADHATSCSPTGMLRTYRITSIHIPTQEDADNSRFTGYNIDSADSACGIVDLPFGVDNALIEVAQDLLVAHMVDVQAAMDAALLCPSGSTTCRPLSLHIEVLGDTDCAIVRLLGEDDTAEILGWVPANILSDGRVDGALRQAAITIQPADDGAASTSLPLFDVRYGGRTVGSEFQGATIGAYVKQADLPEVLATLVSYFPEEWDITVEDLQSVIASNYDQNVDDGSCSGLSFGLTASAV